MESKLAQDPRSGSQSSELVITHTEEFGIGVIELNRPQRRNALSKDLIDCLVGSLQSLDADDAIRVILLTSVPGCPFSAGADLTELSKLSTSDAHEMKYLQDLSMGICSVRKPIVAAIEGYALGGGFEVALMCDLLIATETAQFGLPEVKIGTIPGAGGTQRLTRLAGKHLAMKMILTGSSLSGAELKQFIPGLHTTDAESLRVTALNCAKEIGQLSTPIIVAAKAAILAAERGLEGGFVHERQLYYSTFDSLDKTEGVNAFLEKRKPNWSHK